MSTIRDTTMIVVGAAIGAVSTWALSGAVATPPERAAKSSSPEVARTSSLTPARDERVANIEKALEQERASRARAESRVVALDRELAAARASSSAVAATASAARDPAAITARIHAIEAEIETAKAAKDGKKLCALYVELSKYGKEAWPVAAKLGALFASIDQDSNELGINGTEFWKTFMTSDFVALYLDAFQNPDAYGKEFRKVALWGLSMAEDATNVLPTMIAALRTEKDLDSVMAIAGIIARAENPPDGTVQALLDAIAAQKNGRARGTLVWSLARVPGDDATRAIASLAAQETDPGTKEQLDQDLKVRASPVAGCYLLAVAPGSYGATLGLAVGDVITSWNGKPVKSWRVLQTSGDDEQPVTFAVFRDGRTFELQWKAGKPFYEGGVSGDIARGR